MTTFFIRIYAAALNWRVLITTLMLFAYGAVANAHDTYNLSAHQLNIPAIQVGEAVYTDVIVFIGLNQVISIGMGAPASSADSYVGGVLLIPEVSVNGSIYTNIAARVALSNVLYIGGYAPALTCGAVTFGGTNGVELYDPGNVVAYSLPDSANTVGPAALTWGAENLGTVYSYTGSLRASLWATTFPYRGGTISGRIAETTPNFTGAGAYSPTQLLAGGYSLSAITAVGDVHTPAAGQYCMVITLDMYAPTGCASSDGYCTMDWSEFPNPQLFN